MAKCRLKGSPELVSLANFTRSASCRIRVPLSKSLFVSLLMLSASRSLNARACSWRVPRARRSAFLTLATLFATALVLRHVLGLGGEVELRTAWGGSMVGRGHVDGAQDRHGVDRGAHVLGEGGSAGHPVYAATALTLAAVAAPRACLNAATAGVDLDVLQRAVNERADYAAGSIAPLRMLESVLDTEMASQRNSSKCTAKGVCSRAHELHWSGLNHSHTRFAFLGPVLPQICREIRSVGEGDEEKRMCWSDALLRPGCAVFSVGSNNQFMYEEEMAKQTPCHIHTFDCTVRNPRPPSQLAGRLTFHRLCLGSQKEVVGRKNFTDYEGLIEVAGQRPDFLKMDIEGYEWEVLPNMVESAASRLARSGEDIFPLQMSVEVHYLTHMKVSWQTRDRSPGEIFMFSNYLFVRGGYVLSDRRDNQWCPHCTEVVFVRVAC